MIDWKVFPDRESRPEARIIVRDAEGEEDVRVMATIEDRDSGEKHRFAFGNQPEHWFEWTVPAGRKREGITP